MMEKIMQALKLSASKFFRYRFRILAAALALAIALSLFHFYTNGSSATAVMSLNYSEASSGLNPNSTRFNISELVSKKVMTRVVEAAGIEDDVTWDQLAACVSASYEDSGDNIAKGYISTSYQIAYNEGRLKTMPEHMPRAEDMVKLICSTYKSYFLENYGDNKSVLGYNPLVGTDSEPYISLSSLEVKFKQISRYIDMRLKENKSYTDESTGVSFNSLLKDVENLTNYDVKNIYSFILETGVSKDKDELVSLETYKNRIEAITYDTDMAYYDADNNGIKLYDEAMSAIVMIPSVDKVNEYYMSRTKTATDSMATAADYELEEATSYKKSITDTNYLISQIKAASKNPTGNLKTAAEMITQLSRDITQISDKLKMLDISYIKHKTQNYLVFTYSQKSFIQRINPALTAIETVGAVLVFYLVLFVLALRQERKKKKKNAKV